MNKNNEDFQTISKLFDEFKAQFSVSESDGILCGLVFINNKKITYQNWLEHCFDHPNNIQDKLQLYFQERKKFFSEIDQDLNFMPLIPEFNDINLKSCLEALKKWCAGFMYGLGLNITNAALKDNPQSLEILTDIMQITQLDTTNISNNEQEQKNYLEILEFVRVGVWTIDQDMRT